MFRRFVPAACLAAVLATALLGIRSMAEPDKVDARACIPGNAWLYVEFGPGQNADWKEFLFGGLPEKERKDAEKALDDIWKEFTAEASKAAGTDVGELLKQVDRVHFALLNFKTVATLRDFGGIGQKHESQRPDVDMVLAVRSKSHGYFSGLMEGDFKKYLEPGVEYRNHKTWLIKTPAEGSLEGQTISQLHMAAVGDTVFVANVRASLEHMLDAADGGEVPGGSISTNPDFARAQKAAGQDSLLLGYVNLKTVFEGVEASLSREDLREYQIADAIMGQSTLRSAVFYSGLDGKYGWSGGSLFLDPSNELWSLIRQAPAKKDLLRFIPASCVGTTVFTLHDPAKMWEKIQAFIQAKVDQLAEEKDRGDFQRELQRMESQLGVSVADILAVVDDEVGWCGLASENGRFDEGSQVVLIELKDVDKAKAVIESLRNGGMIEEMGGEITSREYEGITLYSFEGGRTPLGYMILDKVFILTFSAEAQTALVDAYKAGKVLENDAQYKAAMKKLPGENSKLYYYNAGAFMRIMATASREIDPEIAEKLKGKGDQGVAIVTVEKADEATLLCGAELNSEYYASIVQAALPALQEQREKARQRSEEMNLQMMQIALASWVNMKGDGRDYPTTLQQLVDDGTFSAEALKGGPNSPSPKFTYAYPPKGFGTDGSFVLVVDNETFADGRKPVLRFNGTVDWVAGDALKEELKKQDERIVEDMEEAVSDAKNAVKNATEDGREAAEKKLKFLEAYRDEVKARVK